MVDVQGTALCFPILQPAFDPRNVTGSKDDAWSVCDRMCWYDMGRALYAATRAGGSRPFFCLFLFLVCETETVDR